MSKTCPSLRMLHSSQQQIDAYRGPCLYNWPGYTLKDMVRTLRWICGYTMHRSPWRTRTGRRGVTRIRPSLSCTSGYH
eukprot:56442-Eustigmatos_ZCMA.PRE.1